MAMKLMKFLSTPIWQNLLTLAYVRSLTLSMLLWSQASLLLLSSHPFLHLLRALVPMLMWLRSRISSNFQSIPNAQSMESESESGQDYKLATYMSRSRIITAVALPSDHDYLVDVCWFCLRRLNRTLYTSVLIRKHTRRQPSHSQSAFYRPQYLHSSILTTTLSPLTRPHHLVDHFTSSRTN